MHYSLYDQLGALFAMGPEWIVVRQIKRINKFQQVSYWVVKLTQSINFKKVNPRLAAWDYYKLTNDKRDKLEASLSNDIIFT